MATHFFTVDVEEYYHASVFDDVVPRSDWGQIPSRVDVGMERLLATLADYGTRATFFVLGWLGQRRPDLVRAIASAGHEVASHGWAHSRVTQLHPDAFRSDVRRAKQTLEDISGRPVNGYRAPSFSITRENDWALDVLIEEGYRYDSSLFPVARPGYGYRGGREGVHWLNRAGGRLLEVPPATLRVGPVRLPASGGAYFRLFPLAVARAAFEAYDRRGASATFYLHPWELDPQQPRLNVPWWTRIRHYGGIADVEARLRSFLGAFRFAPIATCADLQ